MIEIILNFNRKGFEEVYFRDDNKKIFFSSNTKEHTILTIVFGAVCLGLLINAVATDNNWSFFIMSLLLFILQFLNLYYRVIPVINWRISVKRHLNKISKYKNCKIILTSNTFSLLLDGNEIIEPWQGFKRVEITETYIALYGEGTYLIPKKTVNEEAFEVLKEEIKDKINKE